MLGKVKTINEGYLVRGLYTDSYTGETQSTLTIFLAQRHWDSTARAWSQRVIITLDDILTSGNTGRRWMLRLEVPEQFGRSGAGGDILTALWNVREARYLLYAERERTILCRVVELTGTTLPYLPFIEPLDTWVQSGGTERTTPTTGWSLSERLMRFASW